MNKCNSAETGQKIWPEFKSRLGTPGRFFPLSEEAVKKMERGLGEWRRMTVLYEFFLM
jgi:hypothetical protein